MRYLLIIKKVSTLTRNIFCLILILILFSSCKTAKDVLTGKKKSNSSDQFLIEKKNPLILPPDYELLPEPETLNKAKSIQKEVGIKKILNKNSEISKSNSEIQNSNSSLEESILKKIKKN
tara:strand:- start:952 stop:1311 length:360 start_codon:yes stop_codon:yes gene_type:complete